MKERIKQYMDYKSISPGELSSLLEVQRSNISHILNGRNKPGAAFIERLLKSFPDLNARWLLTGEEQMVMNTAIKNIEQVSTQPDKVTIKKELQLPLADSLSSNDIDLSEDKKIERVVLLYTDGTFTDFNKK